MARSAAASTGPDIVGLGPVGVALTGLGPAWRASLALALGPLPPATGPVAVHVAEEPWPPLPPGTPVAVGPDVHLRTAGADLDLHDRRTGARARLAGDRVLLSTEAGAAAPSGRVLPFALAPPLLAAGVALVHAAVVAAGDRALLVVGPTGAGKSTTAAAARAAGLAVLGDDVAAVGPDDDGWWAQGLARPVRVPPPLAPGAPPVDGDRRGRVGPEGWAEGGTARLVGVALVGHGTDGGWAAADPAAVARTVVASAFATGRPASVAPSLRVGAGLAALPGWDLALAADPATRLPAAATALASILREL